MIKFSGRMVKLSNLGAKFRKGEARKDRFFVENLLLAERFSIAEIANFAGVTEVFVKKVSQEIKRLPI